MDPEICPVTYECVSIDGPSESFSCDSSVFKLDDASGQITVTTSDMARFKPGDYQIVIRGSAGTQVPLSIDVAFTLKLENPCPSVTLSNL